MELNVLGQFEVLKDGVVRTPSAPKVRQVLALFAMNVNRLVHVDQLVEELWEHRPPPSAMTTVQTYVYVVRKMIRKVADGDARLLTVPGGYVFAIDPAALDVLHFARLADEGKERFKAGALEEAALVLQSALDLWRGPVLSSVALGPLLQASAMRWEEARNAVLYQRIDVDLQLGKHAELISELTGLVAQRPVNEGLQAKLMLTLHRAGRRSEALQAYQRARTALADELGVEPSVQLQRLHEAMLKSDPSIEAPAGASTTARAAALPGPPRLLPPDIPLVAGRDEQVAGVSRELRSRRIRPAPPVVVVAAAPGSGKSAFCVHVAHLVKATYPDGQLYARLMSPAGDPVDPKDVLGGFLQAFGYPAGDLPPSLGGRARLWRSWTAERRVLVVLRDVVQFEQMRPLLPTGAGCATLIASRKLLADASLTMGIVLCPLDRRESRRLLTGVIAPRRLEADPGAVDELLNRCGGLPLLLRAAATRLELRPHWPVRRLLPPALDPVGLPAGTADVLASVRRTYTAMSLGARRAFLAAAAVPRTSPRALADGLGNDEQEAESLLDELVEFQLAESSTAENGTGFLYQVPMPFRAVARSLRDQDGSLSAMAVSAPLA
ncbi:AfsR/SARP family transcriptional regulator [Amycolatopsis rubida]|uniref:AfsR/SARP family transcriptional regulator n=1 Tax=Amycolatopsis rubida TaxID=112413 RepID=UPI00142F358F|nr:AfsR/SARP family transcriptional regulator [Amycolatopsis rubida]